MNAEKCILDWAWAGSALEDHESGDLHVVVPFEGGAMVALVDGLGHGLQAAIAARAAAPVLTEHASESVLTLVQRCHEALRTTRGAVMSVTSFSALEESLTWVAVGNVDAVLCRARQAEGRKDEAVAARGGVVGYQLPPLRAVTVPLSRGDTLLMATDGIRQGFTEGVMMEQDPQEIADFILAHHARGTDDAHVVVARYLGREP